MGQGSISVSFQDILSVLSFLIAAFTFLHGRFVAHAKMSERITTLETRFAMVWEVIKDKVAAMVKAPTHYEMDRLIDKFTQNQLYFTLEEANQLRPLLQQRSNEDIDPAKQLAASILLAGLEIWVHNRQEQIKREKEPRAPWPFRRGAAEQEVNP